MKPDAAHTVLAGRYELLNVTGRGGMAIVWRAIDHKRAGRTVAVKRILLDLASDPKTGKLFVEEARVGSQLKHPNIVKALGFGRDELDEYFLVMEWVEGLDLLEYMRSFHQARTHIPWAAVAVIGEQALRGLEAAHEHVDEAGLRRPVIHRDLSPANILIGLDGIVKLADFGLARAADRMSMTYPNLIKGKLAYTAPEVAAGSPVSERSDIFGIGVTLWECLAGRRMFPGETNLDVIRAIHAWMAPALAALRPDIPSALVAVITRATSRDPAARWACAGDMRKAMQKVLDTLSMPITPIKLGASIRAALERLKSLDEEIAVLIDDSEPIEVSVDIPVDFSSSPSIARVGSKRVHPDGSVFVPGMEEVPTVPTRPGKGAKGSGSGKTPRAAPERPPGAGKHRKG